MRRAFMLVLFISGCGQSVELADSSATDATADTASEADAADVSDDGCLSYARPTGTCTQPGVCCLSSACVMGICR